MFVAYTIYITDPSEQQSSSNSRTLLESNNRFTQHTDNTYTRPATLQQPGRWTHNVVPAIDSRRRPGHGHDDDGNSCGNVKPARRARPMHQNHKSTQSIEPPQSTSGHSSRRVLHVGSAPRQQRVHVLLVLPADHGCVSVREREREREHARPHGIHATPSSDQINPTN